MYVGSGIHCTQCKYAGAPWNQFWLIPTCVNLCRYWIQVWIPPSVRKERNCHQHGTNPVRKTLDSKLDRTITQVGIWKGTRFLSGILSTSISRWNTELTSSKTFFVYAHKYILAIVVLRKLWVDFIIIYYISVLPHSVFVISYIRT